MGNRVAFFHLFVGSDRSLEDYVTVFFPFLCSLWSEQRIQIAAAHWSESIGLVSLKVIFHASLNRFVVLRSLEICHLSADWVNYMWPGSTSANESSELKSNLNHIRYLNSSNDSNLVMKSNGSEKELKFHHLLNTKSITNRYFVLIKNSMFNTIWWSSSVRVLFGPFMV